MKSPLLALSFLLTTLPLAAQSPRPVTHDDYDRWPSLRSITPSPDGAWVLYTIAPQQGDGVLEVRAVDSDTVHRFPCGEGARFTGDGRFVVFRVVPSKAEARAARIAALREAIAEGKGRFEEPKKDDDAPRAKLGILDLQSGTVEWVERLESFDVAEHRALVAYRVEPEKPKKKERDAEGKEPEAGEPTEPSRAAPATTTPGEPGARRGRRGRGPASGAAGEAAPAGARGGDERGFEPRDGKPLVVRDLAAGTRHDLEFVLSHRFVADDRWLLFDVQRKAPKAEGKERKAADGGAEGEPVAAAEQAVAAEPVAAAATGRSGEPAPDAPEAATPAATDQGLFALELATGRRVELLDGPAAYGGYATDRPQQRLAFWSNLDDVAAEKPKPSIYLWDFSGEAAVRVLDASTPGLPAGMQLGTSGLGFSRDGSVLTFMVEEPESAPIPPVLPEDKVDLDLWHWRDGSIQPMQKRRRGNDRERWTAAYFVDEARAIVLGDEALPSMRLVTADGSRALATDSRPYEALVSWDGRYSDVWLVNTVDGTRKKLLTQLRGSATPSPTGRFVTYFGVDRHWHAIDLTSGEDRVLTGELEHACWREDDDTPDPAGAYGVAGWLPDDRAVVVYDRYDLWSIDPRSGDATCVTDGFGRANRIVLRYVRIDLEGDEEPSSGGEEEGRPGRGPDDDDRAMPERVLLSGLDEATKASSWFVDSTVAVGRPQRLITKDARFGNLTKAKQADRFFYTVETFADFPDLWTADLEFRDERRLTDANPLLRERRWGRAELVEWRSADGEPLQGKLVVPDDFDPSRRYPMMVYFYEKLSQNLHRHVAPTVGTSPNAAYYVSNGYLWFEPDIVYREGYPGESAMKCIVPGVQSLIARGFVDEKAIGIAGHSWGGYQTSYLVTQTDLFAAAESGAPVSNMISAYGGIRWGTGMSRQFQYEQTQSRIGGTPWQYPLRYMENSPIFFADKVRTPVLILHNDQDGAVPWYQGIEYFMALRRLGKEAYLFNYVGEDHGLRKRANQRDWTRRMQEFFDHHLKGAPAPDWMVEGVEYAEREREKLRFAPSFIEASAPAPEEVNVTEPVSSEAASGETAPSGPVEAASAAPAASRAPVSSGR